MSHTPGLYIIRELPMRDDLLIYPEGVVWCIAIVPMGPTSSLAERDANAALFRDAPRVAREHAELLDMLERLWNACHPIHPHTCDALQKQNDAWIALLALLAKVKEAGNE